MAPEPTDLADADLADTALAKAASAKAAPANTALIDTGPADALAAARSPVQAPAMPPAPLRVRLRTSPVLRRLLPSPIVVRRAAARARAIWEKDPEVREQALESMRAILGGTPRAGEVAHLARAQLIEHAVNETLFWHPWQPPALDLRSQTNLHAALSSERGVLLSSCHMGPVFLTTSAISAAGRTPYTVVAPWFFQQPSADRWGRRIAHWRQQSHHRDHRVVCSEGSFPVLQTLLREGEVVKLCFDMPGSTQTRFLGKPVMLASGSARLARVSDALVLPIRMRRSGHRGQLDVREPLDPRDFADVQELHTALAAVHERLILELPHTLENPRRVGAWEQGATAQAWTAKSKGTPPRNSSEGSDSGHSRIAA